MPPISFFLSAIRSLSTSLAANSNSGQRYFKRHFCKNLGLTSISKYFIRQLSTTNNTEILTDTFNRYHNYLRISLTERCNLRCNYCMPHDGVKLTPSEKLLTLEENIRLIDIFADLGINKLRFTGGEPTISRNLIPLISHAKSKLTIKTIGILIT